MNANLRICLDAHMVGEQETGNETYIINLLRGLQEIGVPGDIMVLTTNREYLAQRVQLNQKFVPVLVPRSPLLRIPISIPKAVFRYKIDLLHVTYVAPSVQTCPTVVSVHDIAYEHFPSFFSFRDRLILSTLVPRSVRQAARVIVPSEHTRYDLIERYRISPTKVVVIPLSVGTEFHVISDIKRLETIKQRYSTGNQYILTVGNLQPRKNLERLIEAYAILQAQLDTIPTLVVVGKSKWRVSRLFEKVTALGLREKIVFTDYVPDEDLALLYNAAEVFVYPSLYEGFGLPPLEAMACGTPVVCSNTSSLPEVVGDAAITVDPTNVEELAHAIRHVLIDQDLRTYLREAGLRRAGMFSRKRTAQYTYEIYNQILTDNNGFSA